MNIKHQFVNAHVCRHFWCFIHIIKYSKNIAKQIALSSSSQAYEHVHLIYEIGYCYEDRR